MTIGPERERVVMGLIPESRPLLTVKMGCYIGYSAVLFRRALHGVVGESTSVLRTTLSAPQ